MGSSEHFCCFETLCQHKSFFKSPNLLLFFALSFSLFFLTYLSDTGIYFHFFKSTFNEIKAPLQVLITQLFFPLLFYKQSFCTLFQSSILLQSCHRIPFLSHSKTLYSPVQILLLEILLSLSYEKDPPSIAAKLQHHLQRQTKYHCSHCQGYCGAEALSPIMHRLSISTESAVDLCRVHVDTDDPADNVKLVVKI